MNSLTFGSLLVELPHVSRLDVSPKSGYVRGRDYGRPREADRDCLFLFEAAGSKGCGYQIGGDDPKRVRGHLVVVIANRTDVYEG